MKVIGLTGGIGSGKPTVSERVVQRSHLTPEAVKKIISTQATTAQRLNAADDVIENVGTFEILKASVLKLHAMYLSLSRKS